jgi:hypothetical protein
MASDYILDLFFLKGDLNRDRQVSIADFITLASNFGKTNATYADGDVNYDGEISIADFIDLAANFNKTLPAPAPALAPQAAAAESISISSASSELLQQDQSIRKDHRRMQPDWHSHRRLHHRRHHAAERM